MIRRTPENVEKRRFSGYVLLHRKYNTAGKRVWTMSAGALFGLNFLAYATVFIIVAVLVGAACFVGIRWRKSKDAKAAPENGAVNEESRA